MKKKVLALFLSMALFVTGCGAVTDENTSDDHALPNEIPPEDNTVSPFTNPVEKIPEEARAGFSAYVGENLTLMGTMMWDLYMSDITGDGIDDICATFFTGSGMISKLVVVYDIQENRGYKLSDRCTYDYMIEDALSDGTLVISRTNWADRDNVVFGSIAFDEDEIFFDDGLDRKGLSFKTLKLFEDAAVYLPAGETGYGDYFSSRDFSEIREFLLCVDNDDAELVHGMGGNHETALYRMSYEALYDILVKIYKEQNIDKVIENMDESYQDGMAVYYDPEYGYIYREMDSFKPFDFHAEVVNVDKNGNDYKITYEVYSGTVNTDDPMSTVYVIIEEADNRYGYSLVRIEK